MGKTFHKPEALADTITHYCPGCTHGVAHRLVAEVIDARQYRARENHKLETFVAFTRKSL